MGCIPNKNRKQIANGKEVLDSQPNGVIKKEKPSYCEAKTIVSKNTNTEQKIKINNDIFVEENKKVFEDSYKIISELGEGSFGKVYKAKSLNNTIVAVKTLVKSKINLTKSEMEDMIKEIEILKLLDHPNIIKIYEYFNSDTKMDIVLEYCNGGELFDEIINFKCFKEKIVGYMMKQLFSAVSFCHNRSIIHRDLKPENILLQYPSNEKLSDKEKKKYIESMSFTVKIVDFGTSVIKKTDNLKEKTGTAYYIAPEVIKNNYNEKCDCWSLGVIMYILLCGSPPFSDDNDDVIFKKIVIGKYSMHQPVWKVISQQAKDLIKRLLTYDFNQRPSAASILNEDPWILSFLKVNSENKAKEDEVKMKSMFQNISNYKNTKKLQQVVIGFIVHHLGSNENVERLRKLFSLIDLNGDGQLTKEELFEGLTREIGEEKAKHEIDLIMATLDNDFSGFIEFQEFLRAGIDKTSILTDQNLSKAFQHFDADNSGVITYDEIKRVLGKDLDVEDNIWKEMVDEVDTDKKGGINMRDFKTMMLNADEEKKN